MLATVTVMLAGVSAWLWWRLTSANSQNAELRSELAKLRRRLQARG